ncbi:hypothetical protein IPN41_03275 [Candidatus Falkowbacteria bacterium]|nr:MAG: hypothetical protein IPN41_03275 [Candidatus Falkowbacteria bacterium]
MERNFKINHKIKGEAIMAKNNQSTQAPTTPKWEIKLDIGRIDPDSSNFIIPIEARVTLNGNAVPSIDVVLKKATEMIGVSTTDDMGIAGFTYEPELKEAGKSINLRIFLKGRVEEKSFSVSLEKLRKTPSVDPEHLDINGVVDNDTGDAIVNATVTDERGNGVGGRKVTFFWLLKKKAVTTNTEGICTLSIPDQLSPGQEIKVSARVSGIRKTAHIELKREAEPDTEAKRKARRNNKLCGIMLLTSVVLWIVCFLIGFGDALISKPEVPSSNWERYFWFGTFIFSIASFLYVPVAFREECLEAWNIVMKKLNNPASDSVGDPFLESTIDDIRNINTASTGSSSSIKQDEPTKRGVSGKYGLGTLFSIDILAEFVMELLPRMLVKIFKPN